MIPQISQQYLPPGAVPAIMPGNLGWRGVIGAPVSSLHPLGVKPTCILTLLPIATSPAQLLLQPKPKPRFDGVKKVCVSRLPRGVKDEFIERILKVFVCRVKIDLWKSISMEEGDRCKWRP
jgi:hypothetical protein